MNKKRFVVAGVLSGIAIYVIMFLVGIIVQLIAPYDILAQAGMRSINDPIMAGFFIVPWILGFVLVIVYEYVKSAFGKTKKEKILAFGILMWLVYNVPSFVITVTSMTYPTGFYLDGIVGGLIYMLVASAIIVKVMK